MEPSLELGSVLLGRYRVLSELARGGMSEVYRGVDEEEPRPVAIKVLPTYLSTEDLHRRFLREAKHTMQVVHRNIVATYDAGMLVDQPFLVMEYLEGDTLFEELRREGPLSLERAVKIGCDVLDGVAAAHARRVIHRDLKPSNVLLDDSGDTKVIDFGLSKDYPHVSGTTITKPRETLGTPSYMSPEQVLGEAVDERTDVYGVGVVLYEMLTAQKAFPPVDGGIDEVFAHVLESVPLPASSIRPGLDARVDTIVATAIAKRPGDRYRSAKAMRTALAALP